MAKEDHVGYTGSRYGMSTHQKVLLTAFLTGRKALHNVSWFHHGDCVGGDCEAQKIAKELGFKIHLHPPLDDKNRAFCSFDTSDIPYSYSGRNQRLALASHVLYATPGLRSVGTWNCVGHATNGRIPVIIIYQHGEVENRG